MLPRTRSARLLVPVLLGGCAALDHDGAPVTAQRPTVSSDTATTAEGSFEIEAGITHDPGERTATPVTIKYGSGPATEMFLGGPPIRRLDLPGGDETGIGDLTVGVRHRFLKETAEFPSAAGQASIKLPTADEDRGLGTGLVDVSFAGIVTKSVNGYALTGYASLDFLGDPEEADTDVGSSLALAAASPVFGRVAGFGEIAALLVPEQDSEQYLATVGLTYNPSTFLVFDAGIALGLNDEAPDAVLLVGVTHNLGRIRRR